MEDPNSIVNGVTDVRELWAEHPQHGQDTQPPHLTDTEIFDLDLKEIKKEAENILQKEHKLRHASKPHSTPLTLKWLEETYEIAEGVCIPRSALYLHYLNFCELNDSQPVNAASFGKIIRQQFPHLTTRRLGTRGQSKYHYYGIGIKETSPYYEVMYSKNGVQSGMEGRKENVRQIVNYSPRSKLGTLLPPFPEIKDLNLPEDMDSSKVSTFLMMYRTHCQRILDTVIRANFDEVESLLLHFWQGMPPHIVPVLETSVLVNLVGACDCILYKAIAAVLMPTVLQALPDSLSQVIRKFARQLDDWLQTALRDLPDTLTSMKFDLSRRFAQVLRRQTALNQLCQAARTVTHSNDIVCQMLEDWSHVDLNSICRQTLYTMDRYSEVDHRTIIGFYKEFEQLLEEHSPLEAYTDWLDSVVDRCVVRLSLRRPGSLRKLARQFLLMWSCFGTRVIRDMTLHSAPSFGSFHLLHLMLDDYVLYIVENLHTQERANDLLRVIRGEMTPDETQYNTCSRVLSMLAGNNSQAYSFTTQSSYYQRHPALSGYENSGNVSGTDMSNMTSYDAQQQEVTCVLDKQTNNPTNPSYSSHTYGQNSYADQADTYHGVISYNNYGHYMHASQKHNYDYRPGQKPEWADSSSYHKYNALLAGSQAQTYERENIDATVNILSDFGNQNYSQTASLNNSSRPHTHVQQGVIYSPYQHTADIYQSDNNNSNRKRKLDDETESAHLHKQLVNQDTFASQSQYSVT